MFAGSCIDHCHSLPVCQAVVLSQSDAFKMNPEPCLHSHTSCLRHLLILAYAARQTRTASSRGSFWAMMPTVATG